MTRILITAAALLVPIAAGANEAPLSDVERKLTIMEQIRVTAKKDAPARPDDALPEDVAELLEAARDAERRDD